MEQTSMNREMRILMLEDTPSDAELAERELRKAGIAFISLRVQTQDAFVRAFDEFHPDIVLSDYSLPDFDGLAALKIVQRDHPEVPVVMVTGALADIDAVELIQAGARDYVLKDRLARLAPAIQRALSAELGARARKAAEKALRESEARYRRITEGVTNYLYTVRIENGRAVETTQSTACETVTGYKPADFVANPNLWIQMVVERDRELVTEHLRLIMEGKDVPPMEHRIIRKDGEIRWVSDTTILFRDASGKLLSYDGVIRDITERKQAEIELNHANRALATMSAVYRQLVYATDENELLKAICRAIVEQRGYRMASVGYAQPDTLKTIKIMAHDGHSDNYLETAQLSWAENEHGMGPSGRAIRSGATQLCQDIANDPHYLPWRDAALQQGYAASIALPLAASDGKVFGILTVYAEEVNAFSPAEIDLFEEMARDLAFGVCALHTRQERDLALKQHDLS